MVQELTEIEKDYKDLSISKTLDFNTAERRRKIKRMMLKNLPSAVMARVLSTAEGIKFTAEDIDNEVNQMLEDTKENLLDDPIKQIGKTILDLDEVLTICINKIDKKDITPTEEMRWLNLWRRLTNQKTDLLISTGVWDKAPDRLQIESNININLTWEDRVRKYREESVKQFGDLKRASKVVRELEVHELEASGILPTQYTGGLMLEDSTVIDIEPVKD